jgi:glycosyltransferase involved in cell wall biosynthesis
MKLSICVATVNGREEKFAKLMAVLQPQLESNKADIELIIDKDNKEISIGSKRQRMLELAEGEYIVWVDDDDSISEDYASQILNNLGEDAVGFLIDCFDHGNYTGRAKASRIYGDWGENMDGFKYVRSLYHKTPVKREIALKAGFTDKRFGEDYEYSMKIKSLIKSEKFIDKVLYFYQYEFEEHGKKYGIK